MSTRSASTSDLPVSTPIALKNVHAIAPPMISSIDLRQQLLDDVDLAGDLRAAEDRDERALGILERGAEILELLLHQQPATAGLRKCATPSVDACARCAEPNASFT